MLVGNMTTLAYIDPGLGALAWQTLAALFVGLVFYLKKTREWLAKAFKKLLRIGPHDAAEATPKVAPVRK
jgi:hypothetical protein